MDSDPLPLPPVIGGVTPEILKSRGMPDGCCAPRWVLEHPDVLTGILRRIVEAGADVVCAPTAGANRAALSKFGLNEKTTEINRGLVELTRRAAGARALVAGVVLPSGLIESAPENDGFEELIEVCVGQGRALDAAGVDMFVIDAVGSISDARAAVIAMKETSDKPITVIFDCGEDGRTAFDEDVLACMTVMQGMGVYAFGLNCRAGPEALIGIVERIYTYAGLPLAAVVDQRDFDGQGGANDALRAHIGLLAGRGVGILYARGYNEGWAGTLSEALQGMDFTIRSKTDCDEIICSSGGEAHFITPMIDVGRTIECSPNLTEDILEAEDQPEGAIKIAVYNEDDVDMFRRDQYMLNKPLCIYAESPAIMEKALKAFSGRAFYDGTGELDDEALKIFQDKYGLIRL